MSTEEKEHWVAQLRQHLGRAKALRAAANADPRMSADRMRLRGWQADRLAATYRDLLDSERYNAAARFFLTDLYGPKDFSERDHEVERILPTMSATLPASGIRTIALAIEVDALSEELDAAMVAELRRARAMSKISGKAYAEAYRRCGKRAQRELQLKLIGEIGEALAALVRKPLVHAALRLMRGPASFTPSSRTATTPSTRWGIRRNSSPPSPRARRSSCGNSSTARRGRSTFPARTESPYCGD